jgi:hypothetical protein
MQKSFSMIKLLVKFKGLSPGAMSFGVDTCFPHKNNFSKWVGGGVTSLLLGTVVVVHTASIETYHQKNTNPQNLDVPNQLESMLQTIISVKMVEQEMVDEEKTRLLRHLSFESLVSPNLAQWITEPLKGIIPSLWKPLSDSDKELLMRPCQTNKCSDACVKGSQFCRKHNLSDSDAKKKIIQSSQAQMSQQPKSSQKATTMELESEAEPEAQLDQEDRGTQASQVDDFLAENLEAASKKGYKPGVLKQAKQAFADSKGKTLKEIKSDTLKFTSDNFQAEIPLEKDRRAVLLDGAQQDPTKKEKSASDKFCVCRVSLCI